MKSSIFNGLLMGAAVWLAYLPIRALPDIRPQPAATVPLLVEPVALPRVSGPWRVAGAWRLRANDPRFGGISGLAMDGGRFLAITDRGAALRFDRPTPAQPIVQLSDLRDGPGEFGPKWARDAESIVADPGGRGWWVAYEQNHSLWLYDPAFSRSMASVSLNRPDWWNNRGAEGLLVEQGRLLVLGENGRDAIAVGTAGSENLRLHSPAAIAEAARAPDGSAWVVLRRKGLSGISQSVGRLLPADDGYRVEERWPVPKAALDNYEGMVIEALPGGGWRFWLVTDDGHRVMARTLLVALDLDVSIAQKKSPAQRTGPSSKPSR